MKLRRATLLVAFAFALVSTSTVSAATFYGNASILANDTTNALSANPANNNLTVSCWFRIIVPTGTNIAENMTILMDRTDGNEGANYSYLLRFNANTAAIEFLTRGTSGAYTNTLIARPYLDRWYHVAVVRQNNLFYFYVDGRALSPDAGIVGNAVGNGLSIGGINGTSKLFRGDIIESAIYRAVLDADTIRQRMFRDQRTFANLTGYYKLGYSTNDADRYRNFVPVPPTGTDPAVKLGVGTIDFEETDQAGEQSLFDSRKNRGDQAITPLSGAFGWSQVAFSRPVPGIAFDLQFSYGSATPTQSPTDGGIDPYNPRVLGPGWRQTFDTRIFTETSLTEFKLLTWDGSIETWTRTNSSAPLRTRHNEYRGELVDTNGGFEWTTPERLVYRFQDPTDATLMAGRLREIRDFNGNRVQLLWNEDEGYITNVVDTVGANYRFNYDTANKLLTNVTFGEWQVNFGYDATNRLVSKSITNTSGLYTPVNTRWQFGYNVTNGLLERIIDPRGNTNLLVQYDKYGRKTNLVDALGRTTRTEYGIPGKRQMRQTDAAGFQWIETYDRKGHILAQQDPLGNITSYTYNTNGNRISITEPLGWTTTFGYDIRANVTAKTNALGEVSRWVFHSFFNKAVQQITPQPADTNGLTTWANFYAYDAGGNLTNHADALGALVRYTYATNGLVLTSTDANGKTSSFGYDTNGFLIARTDAGTNTWTFTVNDVGWKTADFNPLSQRNAYSYDVNGNVVLTVDQIFRELAKTYDANGNLLTVSDAKEKLTRFGYDVANQKTNMVDRTGTNIWTYFYTSRGKPDRAVNPLGYATTNFYDAANRLVAASDPLGNTVTNQYDANGNSTALIDAVGQKWGKTYDRLNRVIAETDPQGDSKQTSFDVAGRIAQITTPNGYPSTHTYDGRGRLTKWVDAENFQWLYDYDGNANITNITDALGGRYVMTYGPRNERLSELNQDLKQWQYTYDELLRLKTQADPNGTVRSVVYDTAGRIQTVNFTTGRQDTYEYDANNNLKVVTRSVSSVPTATGFNYDILDRVTKVTDAFYFEVGYGFDALGRATSITYPGNKVLTQKFDAVNRLTNSVDWAGRSLDYAYDKAGRLIRRAYPNGVIQTNTFDTAGQITGLTYSGGSGSNALDIALAYAYDRNGNKVGGGEKGTFQWPLPTLATEQAHYTPAGRLIDRQINNIVSNQLSAINYAYDSSGNMTNATGQGQTWGLTYDEDNRTTSIRWDAGITSKNITNRYDALGRRVAKTVDGIESRFVLDLSGSMERVLCDADASGTIRAWYVHGPDLSYRVDNTNALICYHADAMANIIALTDGGSNLMAQFAYTPYGRSLGSTNFSPSTINSQPYTFVGSQGVMEELPGLFFMRARYYSADAGVFLSTDPVKKIGPGWKSTAYTYADNNAANTIDPSGLMTPERAARIERYRQEALHYELEAIRYEMYANILQGVYDALQTTESLVTLNWVGVGTGLTKQVAGLLEAKGYSETGSIIRTGAGVVDVADGVHGVYKNIQSAKILGTAIGQSGINVKNVAKVDAYGSVGKLYRNLVEPAVKQSSGWVGGAIASGINASQNTATINQTVTSANQTSALNAGQATTQHSATGSAGATTSSGGGSTTYTVRAGDTLGNIGYANGTTASAIAAQNGIQNPNLIHPGQVLTIRPR